MCVCVYVHLLLAAPVDYVLTHTHFVLDGHGSHARFHYRLLLAIHERVALLLVENVLFIRAWALHQRMC